MVANYSYNSSYKAKTNKDKNCNLLSVHGLAFRRISTKLKKSIKEIDVYNYEGGSLSSHFNRVSRSWTRWRMGCD